METFILQLIGLAIGVVLIIAFNFYTYYRTIKRIDTERKQLGMRVPERDWLLREKN